MMPSPSDLSYFAEVANQLNVSNAAKKLGISQPSLTLAIQRLEETVGTPILIRHKRGVTLTKAGQKLLAHTRELLDQWLKIKAGTLACANQIQGTVTLGCHPSVALYSLPRFLPDLINQYPLLNIQLKHDISRRITDEVINLKVDIAIVVNPERHPDLVITHLDTDKMQLWRSQQNFATQTFDSGEAVLICDTQLSQIQSILKSLKQSGLQYKRLISTNSLEVIADLTRSGCGIGIVPGNIAKSYNLAEVADSPYFEDEICLLYRGENRNVRVIQAIADAIKAGFK